MEYEGFKKSYINLLKEQDRKDKEKETLLSKISQDPNLISNWSIDRLKKLDEIYSEKIYEYDKEIERLKKQMP